METKKDRGWGRIQRGRNRGIGREDRVERENRRDGIGEEKQKKEREGEDPCWRVLRH